MLRGRRGSRGASRGSKVSSGGSHGGLMGSLMIFRPICLYMCDLDFSCGGAEHL